MLKGRSAVGCSALSGILNIREGPIPIPQTKYDRVELLPVCFCPDLHSRAPTEHGESGGGRAPLRDEESFIALLEISY